MRRPSSIIRMAQMATATLEMEAQRTLVSAVMARPPRSAMPQPQLAGDRAVLHHGRGDPHGVVLPGHTVHNGQKALPVHHRQRPLRRQLDRRVLDLLRRGRPCGAYGGGRRGMGSVLQEQAGADDACQQQRRQRNGQHPLPPAPLAEGLAGPLKDLADLLCHNDSPPPAAAGGQGGFFRSASRRGGCCRNKHIIAQLPPNFESFREKSEKECRTVKRQKLLRRGAPCANRRAAKQQAHRELCACRGL